MQLLVTGGRGVRGVRTIRLARARGPRVRVFDAVDDRIQVAAAVGAEASDLGWTVGDVVEAGAVSRAVAGADAIIHFAGVMTTDCRKDPVRGAKIDLIGALNVFRAALDHGVGRLAWASSAAVFAPDDGRQPRPITHYGAYKLAAEACARAHFLEDGLSSVAFRPAIVYGPGREAGLTADPSRAVGDVLAGRPARIGWRGPTGFVHVDDVAEAFLAAIERSPVGAHAFNLGGEVASAEAFAAELARQSPGARIAVEGDPLPLAADLAADDLDAVLPGLPHTSLVDGIARTIAELRADGLAAAAGAS